MASTDLVAVAAAALCARLGDSLSGLPGRPEVVAAAPWRGPDCGISVHLHGFSPAVGMRNESLPGRGGTPSQTLMLRFLLSFFGPDDLLIHRLAGRAADVILSMPALSGDALAGPAQVAGLEAGSFADARMHLALDSLSIDEMTSLWQRFAPMRYTLSLGVRCDITG